MRKSKVLSLQKLLITMSSDGFFDVLNVNTDPLYIV